MTAPKPKRSLLIVGGARHGQILELPTQRLPPKVQIDDAGHHVSLRITSWASHALMTRALDGDALRVPIALHPEAEPGARQPDPSTAILDAVLRAVRAGRLIPIITVPPGAAR